MNYAAFQAVAAAHITPAIDKLVLTMLAWHADRDTGHAWPGQERLVAECSSARSSIKRALKRQREAGVLVVVRQARGGNTSRSATVYGFDLEVLDRLAITAHERTLIDAQESGLSGSRNDAIRVHAEGISGSNGGPNRVHERTPKVLKEPKAPKKHLRTSRGAGQARPRSAALPEDHLL